VGSFNYVFSLDQGILRDDANQAAMDAYNNMTSARWLAEETIRVLEGHADANALPDRRILAQAYLYSGILHTTLPDMFEDVTFSDRQTAGPPVGEANMGTVYDMAVERLTSAITVARAANDGATEVAALALRARAHWAKALWGKFNPQVNLGDPLINDAAANTDAAAVLARVAPNYRHALTFGPSSQQSNAAFNANSRLEVAIAPGFLRRDPSGRLSCTLLNPNCREDGTAVFDAIDNVRDPALRELAVEFIQGGVFSSVITVSARELNLILAEAALKAGNLSLFADHINAVRGIHTSLTPYDPAIHTALTPLEVLRHHRKVNLFNQTYRRLGDMYRFGETSPYWIDTADALTRPGSVLPISRVERQSNCHLNGTC
jgi:starch-binding outer membrane protein, SusD/RagB family